MKKLIHNSITSSHYNKEADTYDSFNEQKSANSNLNIELLLKKYKVKSVVDLTCGTGSQVLWLTKKGFEIEGYDISPKMIKIAKEKSKKENLNIKFAKGDMRTTKAGLFDAAITIFNAIGHLTKEDFEKAIKNIYSNLNDKGIYIFDIFNLDYLLKGNNITKLTIDWLIKNGNRTFREIQYSTIDSNGILASYDIYHENVENSYPKITKSFQTLQIYNLDQLTEIVEKNGFTVIEKCGFNRDHFTKHFIKEDTERILIVAKKI